ncbi:MAG: hypothetical protein RML12_10980 [Xanthomonadales bacterium]|nr:hypothetical protein [Xanthomonadales bacterium]
MVPALSASPRRVLVAASAGTVFEWFDFFLYGSLAVFLAAAFFPAGNPTAALLASLATFGVGFVVRPLGAALFGHLGDRHGRHRILLLDPRPDGRRDLRHRPAARLRHPRAWPRPPSSCCSGCSRGLRWAASSGRRAPTSPSTRRRDGAGCTPR